MLRLGYLSSVLAVTFLTSGGLTFALSEGASGASVNPINTIVPGPTPSPNAPKGQATFTAPSIGASPNAGSAWSCAVSIGNANWSGSPRPYGSVDVEGINTCVGFGYAPQRMATSIWTANLEWQVAGWNFASWTNVQSSTKTSQLICLNSNRNSYVGVGLGQAEGGNAVQSVQSANSVSSACGWE